MSVPRYRYPWTICVSIDCRTRRAVTHTTFSNQGRLIRREQLKECKPYSICDRRVWLMQKGLDVKAV